MNPVYGNALQLHFRQSVAQLANTKTRTAFLCLRFLPQPSGTTSEQETMKKYEANLDKKNDSFDYSVTIFWPLNTY